MRVAGAVGQIVYVAAALVAAGAVQASGSLDRQFDGDGVRVSTLGGQFESYSDGLIDPQGRHVAVGAVSSEGIPSVGVVERLLPDGQRDPSFGEGGVVTILPIDAPSLSFQAIERQPDGRLVVAGNLFDGGNIAIQVCRLHASGALDAGFADDGCRRVPLWFASSNDRVYDMALQPDGRIVLVAHTDFDQIGDFEEWAVARLDGDGAFDRCFGDPECQLGGVLIQPEPALDLPVLLARRVAIDGSGRIVVAGTGKKADAAPHSLAAVRLLASGVVDASFGEDGHRLVNFGLVEGQIESSSLYALAVQGDAVFLGGDALVDGGELSAIARLDADGNLDPGFGGDGRVSFFYNDVFERHRVIDLALQEDGKLLAAGVAEPHFGFDVRDCGVARFNADGTPDTVFAIDGVFAADAGLGLESARYDQCNAVATRGNAIVLFGDREISGLDYDQLQIRLDVDGLFADGFD
jgi:uncharacterized delta-60 repeat protein